LRAQFPQVTRPASGGSLAQRIQRGVRGHKRRSGADWSARHIHFDASAHPTGGLRRPGVMVLESM